MYILYESCFYLKLLIFHDILINYFTNFKIIIRVYLSVLLITLKCIQYVKRLARYRSLWFQIYQITCNKCVWEKGGRNYIISFPHEIYIYTIYLIDMLSSKILYTNCTIRHEHRHTVHVRDFDFYKCLRESDYILVVFNEHGLYILL